MGFLLGDLQITPDFLRLLIGLPPEPSQVADGVISHAAVLSRYRAAAFHERAGPLEGHRDAAPYYSVRAAPFMPADFIPLTAKLRHIRARS
jgi:hypothetical protein